MSAGQPMLPLGAPSLPARHLEAIKNRYELVSHVPGPLLNGIYLYEPKTVVSAQVSPPTE
jgi:hypothetical protein